MNKYEPKRGCMRKAIKVTIGAVVGVAVIAAVLAVALGYVSVTVKDPSDKVIVRAQVCGDDIIGKYNEAAKSDNFDDHKAKLKEVFDGVSSREGYMDDATCAFIAYRYHLLQNEAEQINATVDSLKRLTNDGVYPSLKLTNVQSIEQIENRASIVDGNVETTSAGGAG